MIPDVPLNIDRRGYAGGLTRRLNFPGVGGGMSSGLGSFLQQQAALRNQIARAQLAAILQETDARRKDSRHGERMRQRQLSQPYGPTNMERMARDAAAMGVGSQSQLMNQAARRARSENEARGESLRMAGTPGAPGPLGFNRYSLHSALKGASGGPTGRAMFQGPPAALMGARATQYDRNPFLPMAVGEGMNPEAYNLRQGIMAGAPSGAMFQDTTGQGLPRGRGGTFTTSDLRSRQKGTLPKEPNLIQQFLAMMSNEDFGRIRNKSAFSSDEALQLMRETGLPIEAIEGLGKYRSAVPTPNNPYGIKRYLGTPDIGYPPRRRTGHQDGTLPGTVPKTGPANIHKGEVVLSADQVDEPLMAYLMTDKLKKMSSGQMDGKGTGPGRSYAAGSMGFATADIDPSTAAAMGLDMLPPRQPEAIEGMDRFFGFGSDESMPRAAGRMIREGAGSLFGGLGGIADDFYGGLTDAAPGAPPSAPIPTVPEPEGETTPAPEPRPSLFDRMLESAEGSKDSGPAFEVGTKGFIESENAKAEIGRMRAAAQKNLQWMMKAAQGGTLTPELFKTMTEQVNQYNKIADMTQKEMERAETVETAEKQAGEDRVQAAYKTGVQAQLGAEDAIRRRTQEHKQLQLDFSNAAGQYRSALEDGTDDEARKALTRMVSKYREAHAAATGEIISWEEAQILAQYEEGLITDEQATTALGQLAR